MRRLRRFGIAAMLVMSVVAGLAAPLGLPTGSYATEGDTGPDTPAAAPTAPEVDAETGVEDDTGEADGDAAVDAEPNAPEPSAPDTDDSSGGNADLSTGQPAEKNDAPLPRSQRSLTDELSLNAESGFETFAMPTGRNYLVWEVTYGSTHIGGATVTVQGAKTSGNQNTESNWAGSDSSRTYNVTDCTSDPCHPNSMDQDPRPGYFAVADLTRVAGTGGYITHNISAGNRYRIQPTGSIAGYTWSNTNWIMIPGTTGNGTTPQGWPQSGPWNFGALSVTPREAINYCAAEPANSYYSLRRAGTSATASRETSIRRAFHNTAETSITQATENVAGSSVTVPAGAIANGLGITPTGVFYFASQLSDANSLRQVTTYRFDPTVDSAPYPVWTMDLLSPTAGWIVAGDATVHDGVDEFYYAYFSSSPVNIDNRSAIRMHLYRYSAGNGNRTGEVVHVDVARPANFTTNANAMNGDFSFDGSNNLQFIISDTNGGYTVSGSVLGSELHSLDAAHTLSDVGDDITATAIGGRLPNGQREAINGVTYTSGGRAIIQQGNLNAFADPTSMSILSARSTLSGGGSLVDLASCAEPTTITVQKYLEGERFAPGDQFTLNASRVAGGTTSNFDSVTTAGSASGLQPQQIGPYAMVFDGTFSAQETISSNAANYDTTWACYVDNETTPFIDGAGRNLSFALSTTTDPDLVPGANIRCAFTNETLRPKLVAEKTSDPESGDTVTAGEVIDYTLTFDNSAGTAAASVDHVDHLRDVLDDAFFVNSGGNPTAAPVVTASGAPALQTSWNATTQQLSITGSVPTGQTRTVSFPVRVKDQTTDAESREHAEAPLAGYWLRNYLTPAGENPPATCEEPADGEPSMCAEHPIPAWSVSKDSRPADGALIHVGGNVNYRVTVAKLNGGAGSWPLEGVVVTDDLTDVLHAAGWTPDATVPAGARSIGIYLFDTAAGGNPVQSIPLTAEPVIIPGSGSAPYFGSTWTLTTPEFDMPADIVRAEIWYTVTAGEAPHIAGEWEPEPIQWGTELRNRATADSVTQNPQQCVTGDPDTFNEDECVVTQRIENGFFTIRKDGLSPDGVETDLIGHAFEIRDDASGVMSGAVSSEMCTVADWQDAGFTGTIPEVPWNVDPALYADAPVDCAYLYPISSGAQEGRWRSQNLPEGTYWLVETRAASGYQLLAEPIKFSVGSAADEGKLIAYDAQGNAQTACSNDPNAQNPTACVNPTGWLMVVQDARTIALPMAGGMNSGAIITVTALLLLTGVLGAAYVYRRRIAHRTGGRYAA